jgi:hypothetical protein
MKLVAHLVRADVRRFRLLLAGWLLIEILNTVLTGLGPVLVSDRPPMAGVALLGTVLFLTRWLGMIVIVALVVQTHPLVGSDAFWLTRPIPPRALLTSKVLLLGTTFIVAPVLCEMLLMAVFRVPPVEIGLVALQTTLFQSLWLSTVMALAAVTRTLAGFVLVVGGVLLSLILLISIGIAMAVRNIPDGPQLNEVTSRPVPDSTAAVVMLLLLMTAMVVPLVIQYLTRSTRVSASAGAVGLAAVILVSLTWLPPERPLPVPAWATSESALRLMAVSPRGEFRPLERSQWNSSDAWQSGAARLRLTGIEPGWLATLRLAVSTVQFGDGATLTTAGNGHSATVPFETADEPPARVVMRHVLGVERVWAWSHHPSIAEAVPAIVLTEAEFRKYSAASGTYRGRFLVDLDHVEIAATLPLQRGAEYRDRQLRLSIDRVIWQTQVTTTRVRLITTASMLHSRALPQLSFYLRNRDAAEAVAGAPHGSMHTSAAFAMPMLFGVSGFGTERGSGFSATSQRLRFPGGSTLTQDPIAITSDWLSRAELVVVRTVAAGSVTRTVEIPGFEIRPAPPAPPVAGLR